MAFAQEKLEDSLRRLRIRQDLADARLDGLAAESADAAAAPSGSAGAMPESALFQNLGRYAHWRPPAFAVWWVSGGGGKVGVSFPEKCVSYNGSHLDDEVLTPGVQEDPETKIRWCELEAPSEGAPKLVLTLLVELDGATHEPGDEVTAAYLEWAASVDAAKADHEETDRKVVACVSVAEYDAKLDRLVQVHVGALALGGGGGGGGGKYTPWPEPFPYGAATVPEYTDAGQTETRDVEYEHYVKADGFVFNGAGTTVPGSGIPVDESTTQVAIVSVGTPPEGWTPGPDGADPDELTWEHRLEKTSSGDVQPPPAPDHGAVVVTPLYDFDKYEVVKDYRGQFLPVTTGVARSAPDNRPPFTVRWSASANNKRGAWVIWLPDVSKLVYINGAYHATIDNTVAEAALPAGWYRMSPVSATATAVWLIVRTYTRTGTVQVYLGTYPGQPQTGYTVSSILVATMAADAQTGAKRVKQFVDSTVVLGGEGSGGSVALDDVSTDFNGDSEVQIKDWDTGTPASSTTIAQDIHDADGATAQGALVERTTGGVLQYKKPGTLEQLLGSSVEKSSQKILTGLTWNTTTHKLVISSANITVANGVITSWTDNNDENIDSVSIKDIINQ